MKIKNLKFKLLLRDYEGYDDEDRILSTRDWNIGKNYNSSSGLGVLAGDHIKAAANAQLPMCAVTLLYKEGYFKQRIDDDGQQTEAYPRFDTENPF